MTNCTKTQKKLCEDYNCDICFERSFVSIDESIFWSDTNDLSPRHVFKNTHTKYFLICPICNHEYDVILKNVTFNNTGCPYCTSKILCDDYNCDICFENSFISEENSIFWSDTNDLSPRHVFKNTHITYFFNCPDCYHEFDTRLLDMSPEVYVVHIVVIKNYVI